MEGQICKVLARCGTGLQVERRKGHGPTSCIAPLSMHELSPGRNANADTPGYPEAQGAKGRPQLKGHTQQRARNLCAVEASIWAWLRAQTLEPDYPSLNPALPLTYCATLNKLLNHSALHIPHL